MLKIKSFAFNMFGENTYLVWNAETKQAAVIDPGMHNAAEELVFDSFITENKMHVSQLINTHMHLDHIIGDTHVKSHYGVGASAGKADAFFGEKASTQARMFGMPFDPEPVSIDIELKDNEKIDICGEEVTILTVPGHSPGSIALYFPISGWVITGDVLFAGSIGRTDLIGGNHATLISSIRNKLFTLPDSTVVYPGHGPSTTIGKEKRRNPYLS